MLQNTIQKYTEFPNTKTKIFYIEFAMRRWNKSNPNITTSCNITTKMMRKDRKIQEPPLTSDQNDTIQPDLSQIRKQFKQQNKKTTKDELKWENMEEPDMFEGIEQCQNEFSAITASKLWCEYKIRCAQDLFQMKKYDMSCTDLTILSRQLDISRHQIERAYQIYLKDPKMEEIRQRIKPHDYKTRKIYPAIIGRINDILDRDGTLTISQITYLIHEQLTRQKHPLYTERLCANQLACFLKTRGYALKRLREGSNARNAPINIQKRYEFAKLYKKLEATKIPIYFYHEWQIGTNMLRNFGWAKPGQIVKVKESVVNRLMIRCVLSPQGVAAWILRFGSLVKFHIEYLFEELEKHGNVLDKDARKFMVVDRHAVGVNRELLADILDEFGFDILALPAQSKMLNPVDGFFRKVLTEMRAQSYTNTRHNLMKHSQRVLKKYDHTSLKFYLHAALRDIDKCLKKENMVGGM